MAITNNSINNAIVANNFSLPNTNSTGTNGVILFGGINFISNYGTQNTFVGQFSGNTNLTIGNAIQNTGIGNSVLSALTIGFGNSCLGQASLNLLTSGQQNTGIGLGALQNLTSGGYNTSIGWGSGTGLLTGSNNIFVGYTVASGYTSSESNNILIGSVGTLGESNVMRLGTNGSGTNQVNTTYIAGAVTIAQGVTATGTTNINTTGANATNIGTGTGTSTFGNITGTTTINFGSGSALSTFIDWTTWTPTWIGGTIAGTTVYALQSGYYMRIGNLVTVSFLLNITSATGTGNIVVDGLPFTVSSAANYTSIGSCLINSGIAWPVGTTSIVVNANAGTTTLSFYCSASINAGGALQMGNVSAIVEGTIMYRV